VHDKPSVLFVCIHNAGRSQMAAAYLTHLAGDRVEVRSAGSAPGNEVNPAAVAAMLEEGIDMSAEIPKVLTDEAVRASNVVITMGCGDTCPIYPGKRYEDWALDDPAGQGVDAVRGKWVHFTVIPEALRNLSDQLADPRRALAHA
jgi:arsenate reductase